MQVDLLSCTDKPLDVISLAAGICYGKTNISHKRVFNCMKMGHGSVLEHASATFLIRDVSRNFTHQLVRHRIASFSEKSQRYVKMNFGDMVKPFVEPEKIEMFDSERFNDLMVDAFGFYEDALDDGVPAEDARYILPSAVYTDIVVTANARELLHIFALRIDKHAQWEIRDVCKAMSNILKEKGGEQWKQLIEHGESFSEQGAI